MTTDRLIADKLAEALQACIDELDEYRLDNLDTIHYVEDVLADYYGV